MALILSIDTAMENARLCIADGADILMLKTNNKQSDHAAWIHKAIKEALDQIGKNIKELKAVAVVSGPGSYTGLRVGMATAKGLCYALNLPLITESTLYLIASRVKNQMEEEAWICPMIDARRMEVFTVLYDDRMKEQQGPSALILDEHSFEPILDRHKIIFAGNGSAKWETICHHSNAKFSSAVYTVNDMAIQASSKFAAQDFVSIAYSSPSYLKNVYTGTKDV